VARTSYILRRAYSHYADIPFQNKDAPFRLDRAFGRRVAWQLLRWLRRHARRDAIEVTRLERITAKPHRRGPQQTGRRRAL
jgi:hypothetical protein